MAKKRWQSYAYLLLNTVCWGAALVIVKPSLAFITPTRFLLYRFFFAALLSIPVLLRFAPKIKKLPQQLLTITLLELLGTSLALFTLYTGLSMTGAIEASLIGTTGPIFIVLMGVFMLHEREEKREWMGLGLSFLGSVLLAVGPFLSAGFNWQMGARAVIGNGLIVLYNIFTAWYFILAKTRYRRLPKLFVSAISFYVGLITFALLALVAAQSAGQLSQLWQTVQSDFSHSEVWVASLYMATFGSIIGLTAYIKGQDGIEASEASLFTYLQPLVYVPLGMVFLHEAPTLLQLISLLLLVLGLGLAEKR